MDIKILLMRALRICFASYTPILLFPKQFNTSARMCSVKYVSYSRTTSKFGIIYRTLS